MKPLSLLKICQIVDGELVGNDSKVNRVCTDSRLIQSGDLFIPLTGEKFNGHDFIPQLEGIAGATLVSQAVKTGLPTIRVKDTKKALGLLAAYHRQQFTIPVIGITGSCGKTTTKEMIAAILRCDAATLAPQASFNNDVGVPLTLLNLEAQHHYAVIEMGTNNPGEIAYLSGLTQPTIAVITNIEAAHIEGLGDITGVINEKSSICRGLPKGSTVILNKDNAHYTTVAKKLSDYNIVTFSTEQVADIQATHIKKNKDNTYQFDLLTNNGSIEIVLPLLGLHNIMNALASAAIANQLGIDNQKIKRGLEMNEPVKGRLQRFKGIAGSCIINDSYNAIPAAVMCAIDILASYAGKRILILGGMAETGEHAIDLHQEMGRYIAKSGINYLFCFGGLSEHIFKGFSGDGGYFDDQSVLLESVLPHLSSDTTVLVKGSRGLKLENIVRQLVVQEKWV